ncbi:MAG: carboxypeptidase-like regulatory domain-containing protein, partial [Myxococcota bacterium]|nr:carboxypeptidase-like regulatory domain-containing protein [Myxococcota bacterium]
MSAIIWTGTQTRHALVAQENTGVITGTVTSSSGPEAGVWVIAETDDLETIYRKIVVTNDDGKFLLPELPEAGFDVWVRGYGLVDSSPVSARPGADLAL